MFAVLGMRLRIVDEIYIYIYLTYICIVDLRHIPLSYLLIFLAIYHSTYIVQYMLHKHNVALLICIAVELSCK